MSDRKSFTIAHHPLLFSIFLTRSLIVTLEFSTAVGKHPERSAVLMSSFHIMNFSLKKKLWKRNSLWKESGGLREVDLIDASPYHQVQELGISDLVEPRFRRLVNAWEETRSRRDECSERWHKIENCRYRSGTALRSIMR